MFSQKVSKTKKSKKNLNIRWKCWDRKQSESESENESIRVDHSVISQNIHGKYSRTMSWEEWDDQSISEDDFTVVSLHIPSNKEVTIHLKFYPAEPIKGRIMIDYEIMFERYMLVCVESDFKIRSFKINNQNIYFCRELFLT